MRFRLIFISTLFALLAAAAIHNSALAQDGCTTDPATGQETCPPDYQNPTKTPVPPTVTPTATPAVETVGSDWSGGCPGDVNLVACVQELVGACVKEGGESSTTNESGGNVTVNCKFSVVLEPTPRPLGIPVPGDGWIGTCTDAAGGLADCIDKFECEDGLLVIKVDIYNGVYDFYCFPHEKDPETLFPIGVPLDPGADDNWVGGCSGGDGMGACLDEMKAACDADGGDYSEWYDEDGGGAYCQNSSEGALPPGQPGGLPGSLPPLGLGVLIGVVGAIAIPAFMKNARKAKTAEAPTNVKKMYDGARSTEGKPKPKPKPKSTIKGDYNSDGTVDSSDT